MPMIAFIGVRISWLMAARNELLAWFAPSAASRASRVSVNSLALSIAIAACCDRPMRKLRSVGVNERCSGPVRQTAIMPLTPPRPISGATISRSTSFDAVPAIWMARLSLVTSLMTSGRASAARVPMIPRPSTTVIALTWSAVLPTAAVARKFCPSASGRNTAADVPSSRSCACFTMRCRSLFRSNVAEISRPTSASVDISDARRCDSP